MSEHIYISTACVHGFHDYCSAPVVGQNGYCSKAGDPKTPAKCKFCDSKCLCMCHEVKNEN